MGDGNTGNGIYFVSRFETIYFKYTKLRFNCLNLLFIFFLLQTPLTEFTVPGLKEFHDYEFRAIALNSHGRGPPSLPTSPIKIQETAGAKPTIVVKPEDIACPYNKRAVLTCEAVGRPKPTARWLRNGREIPDGARYRVEDNGEGLYKLIIKEVWDIDGGDYTCEVK
jgi:hypothetical protein